MNMIDTTDALEGGLPQPVRNLAITAVLIAFNLSVMMGSITNVALPTIAAELSISPADAIWVINIYQLALLVVLLPISALADQIGYRPIYLTGLVTFVFGAALCGFSNGFEALLAGRALQGLGSAAIQAVYVSSIAQIYPRRLVGRGVGLGTLTSQISAMTAPSIAAFVLLIGSWQWLFLLALPFGILSWWISKSVMPAAAGSREKFQWLPAGLNLLTFGFLVIGLDALLRIPNKLVGGSAALAGVAAGAVQIYIQRGTRSPIIPIDLLRLPPFAFSMLGSFAAFAASSITLVSLPFLFQSILGLSAQQAALLMTAWPIFMALSGFLTGWLFNDASPSRLGAVGLGVMALGLVALYLSLNYMQNIAVIAFCLGLTGAGFGTFVTPNLRAIIMIAPVERSGAASGMQAASRLFGQIFGAIIVAVVLGDHAAHEGAAGLIVAASLAVAGSIMSALRRMHAHG